jgi:predicted DsbA family dithiol-disulfide isomerase
MKVEIWSDVVCPWCYIGKRRFEAALARFDHADEVEIVFRPYQLDPGASAVATPALEGYARKFGGPEQAVKITQHLTDVAAADGLTLDFAHALRANTFDAHRLLWLAERPGVQVQMKERLLQAYFVEGVDIGNLDELVRLAGEVGLDEEETRAALASGAGADEVRAELTAAAELGVTAVPTFVFEGRWAVPGAQDPDTMLSVLNRVQERLVEPRPS